VSIGERSSEPRLSADEQRLVRELAPQVLAALVRRYGRFTDSEDAVQEALVAASLQWPHEGRPRDPRAWLIRVASRRLIDELRRNEARRRREDRVEREGLPLVSIADPLPDGRCDDTLGIFVLACHPSLTLPSQVALTLRAVGGLTTQEIARAFVVPEATMAQRISRAKARIAETAQPFLPPPVADLDARLHAVRHVLHLIFNEGYLALTGSDLHRQELADEGVRLTRLLCQVRDDPPTRGLLALMLLTAARTPARLDGHGRLVPLTEQDRRRWDRRLIDEGLELTAASLGGGPVGTFQVQAAIAAVHSEAATADETDWPQILALYDVLRRLDDGPIVQLNRVVAYAMVHGPRAGLIALADLESTGDLPARFHRPAAVRGHLLAAAGEHAAAAAALREAAMLTTSLPEREYLEHRAARCAHEQNGRG
jgi:RNA polymerase sigma factor (sigma-70 family)